MTSFLSRVCDVGYMRVNVIFYLTPCRVSLRTTAHLKIYLAL